MNKSKHNAGIKRKKLTENIINDILSGKLIIWIWTLIDNQERPIQMAFPGKPTLHRAYPDRNSYFTCPNADDNFYFKEFDYFWFVTPNKPPEKSLTEAALDDMLADPEAMQQEKSAKENG